MSEPTPGKATTGVQVYEQRMLFGIVVAGLLLRALAILAFPHAPESDELAYRAMVLNFLDGRGVVDHMGNLAVYNVGYPLFVLLPGFLVSPDGLGVVRALNALLGGVGILLCHSIARLLGAGYQGRLLAAAFSAVYLPAAIYSVYLVKENLMVPLMLASIHYSLHLMKAPSPRYALGAGTCFGMLALTGNAALSLAIIVPFALYFARFDTAAKFRLLLLFLIPAVAIPAPWVIRNTLELGAPVLNTNGGFNLYLGNNPAATGVFISIADTPQGPQWQSMRQAGELQASETLGRKAMAWIVDNPQTFAFLAIKKLGYFWMPPIHRGVGEASLSELILRALWAVQFVLLVVAALATLSFNDLRSAREVQMIWLAIAAYSAVHMLFYVIFRYREPVMPLLCILSALALDRWLSRRKMRVCL